MINVKEFVYCKLSSDASLSSLVGNRIFANIMPEMNKTFPVIIYQRISNGKWDTKGIRNEYFQISSWGKSVNENEIIMGMITSIFNNLKELPVKFCNILSIDETFDSETQLFGMHVSIHIKLFDTDF